jgi:hypothetical protein
MKNQWEPFDPRRTLTFPQLFAAGAVALAGLHHLCPYLLPEAVSEPLGTEVSPTHIH